MRHSAVMRSVRSGGARGVVDIGDDDRDARRRLRPTDLKTLVQRIEVGSAEIQISGAILKLLQTVPSSEEVPVWNLVQTAFAVPFRAGSPG